MQFLIMENKKAAELFDGIPVVHSWEIGEMKDPAEFLKMLAERRESIRSCVSFIGVILSYFWFFL